MPFAIRRDYNGESQWLKRTTSRKTWSDDFDAATTWARSCDAVASARNIGDRSGELEVVEIERRVVRVVKSFRIEFGPGHKQAIVDTTPKKQGFRHVDD